MQPSFSLSCLPFKRCMSIYVYKYMYVYICNYICVWKFVFSCLFLLDCCVDLKLVLMCQDGQLSFRSAVPVAQNSSILKAERLSDVSTQIIWAIRSLFKKRQNYWNSFCLQGTRDRGSLITKAQAIPYFFKATPRRCRVDSISSQWLLQVPVLLTPPQLRYLWVRTELWKT